MGPGPKELWIAYLLCIFLGYLGIHKFYCNKPIWGLVYLFTGGIFGIGWIVDLFLLPGQVRRANADLGYTGY